MTRPYYPPALGSGPIYEFALLTLRIKEAEHFLRRLDEIRDAIEHAYQDGFAYTARILTKGGGL